MKRHFNSATLLLCLATSVLCTGAMAQRGGGGNGGGHGGGGQQEVRLRAILTGAPINAKTPRGHVDFRSRSSRKQFQAEVEKVNLSDGTVLSVNVNGVSLGMITLAGKEGELELNTKDGDAVPDIHSGDVVTITAADGTTVESGTF